MSKDYKRQPEMYNAILKHQEQCGKNLRISALVFEEDHAPVMEVDCTKCEWWEHYVNGEIV